ncbi:hypothetical protein [Haloplanus sp. C73]|uniref:hypothetical protein n=1 Tax=Haloplanus sp. C73 TaxID=3421641 RepID=UPI003EB85A6C
MACFACDSESTRWCSLYLDDGPVIENRPLCERCAEEFERVEWIDIQSSADGSA